MSSGFFDGVDDLGLITQLPEADGGDDHIHQLDRLNQTLVVIYIPLSIRRQDEALIRKGLPEGEEEERSVVRLASTLPGRG